MATIAQPSSQGNKPVTTETRSQAIRDYIKIAAQIGTIVAILLSISQFLISINQFNQQQTTTQKSTVEQRNEATLSTYFDRMSDLLLTYHLATSKSGSDVRALATARTLTALRNLDSTKDYTRVGTLIQFLWEAQLINGPTPIIPLSTALISQADLSYTYLGTSNFHNSFLEGANFTFSDLHQADLSEAHLKGANFTAADVTGVNFTGADLQGATFIGSDVTLQQLHEAALTTGVILPDGSKYS